MPKSNNGSGRESICFTDAPPFDGSPVEELRFREQAPGSGRPVFVSTISVECLRTLGIRSVSGRAFERNDELASAAAPPVVVSKALARSLWPQESPIGKSVFDRAGTALSVIGVVNDADLENVGAKDGSRLYRLEPNPRLGDTLILRVKGDPDSIVGAVSEIVRRLDPDLVVIPATVRSEIDQAAKRMRGFIAMMVTLAGGIVFLAVMGIYGVVWFAVSQRTKELGIRIALGASKLNLVVQVVRSNTRPVIFGQFAGLLLAVTGSVALARVSTDNRVFTNAPSPVVYIVAFLILQVAALLAMLGPAIAAARKDPMNAMRQE